MLRCVDAEIETMRRTGLVAPPFYVERAAILLRKAKEFDPEVLLCESYVSAVELSYAGVAEGTVADVRKGPRFAAIRHRLVKARELLAKAKQRS